MFRKLFGGGKADIFLETELDGHQDAKLEADGQPLQPEMIKVDIARRRHRSHRPPAGQAAGRASASSPAAKRR